MRRLLVAVASLVAWAALAACGGGDDDEPATGAVAGNVIEVFNRLASVDGKRVAGGDPIGPRAVLSTDQGGAATFSVGGKLDDCQIRPESAAQVLPQPGVLLDYQRGWTLCRTAPGDLERTELTAGNRRLTMVDPVWAVGALAEAVTLRVFRGFVELRAATGPGRLVGPDSQSTAPDRGEAAPAEHFDRALLDQLDRRGVERMEASLPAPNLGLPSSEGSPTLAAIRRRGSLRVGVDVSRSAQTAAFVGAYFDLMARHWDVRVDVVPSRRPAADVEQDRADVAVLPDPTGASGIPFFDDDEQRRWSMAVGDPGLGAALRTFLLGVLDIGEYGRQYRTAFGAVPSYEAVRPLVLPERSSPPGSTTVPPVATSAPSTTPLLSTTTSSSTSTSTSTSTTTTAPSAFSVSIASGSVTKPPASDYCPATVTFTWALRSNGPGVVTYRFTRSDGASSSTPQTLRFEGSGTRTVTTSWTLGVTPYEGWVALQISSPQAVERRLEFTFSCQSVPG